MSERVKTEGRFWEERYRTGGDSGKGSVGAYRKWKWKTIKKYINPKEKSVLDVGCGDLQFMKGQKFKHYVGVDISSSIIEKNRAKRPDWAFLCADVATYGLRFRPQPFDVVFCMDVLFHIMNDERYGILLDNLNRWAGEWLFIVSWAKNPLPYLHDYFQYYRDLKEWLGRLPDFALVGEHQKKGDEYNTLYVFRRIESIVDVMVSAAKELQDMGSESE
jgi:SAM-dependent methyltransferase